MKKAAPFIGGGFFIVTFALFYLLYKYVFVVDLFLANCVGLAIWSLFIGFAFFLYSFLQRKTSFVVLGLTYMIAIIALYQIFANTNDVADNIKGLLTFFMVMLVGFIITLLFEIYMWSKNKKQAS